MAKKKKQQTTISNANPLVELGFDDPLFALAAHPTQPLLLSGLGTGHVYLHKYNASLLQEKLDKRLESLELADTSASAKPGSDDAKKIWSVSKAQQLDSNNSEEDDAEVQCLWKTKRHKSSCRTVLMDPLNEGKSIYTIGKDMVIKKAFTETGKVDFKRSFADEFTDSSNNFSCGVLSSTHPQLVTGDEQGTVRVFDTRTKFDKMFEIKNVHDDMVNQIIGNPGGSAYHYISVGSTTVAKIDIRKNKVLMQSENQEDEVLAACFPNPSSSDSLLCGMGLGVVTLWKEKKNEYADQLSRIKLLKDNSIDCIISTMNEDEPDSCWAGCSDGGLYKVNGKRTAVVETRVHDDLDEVNLLDIDYDYRLISAGMSSLKIWSNVVPGEEDFDAAGEDDDIGEDEDDSSSGDEWSDVSSDGSSGSESGSDDDGDKGDEDEEKQSEKAPLKEEIKSINKKRKQAEETLKETTEADAKPKKPKQQPIPKKLLRKQEHEHGIFRFEGLE